MPRDDEAVKIRPWADRGRRHDPEDDEPPLDRALGYTQEYSLPGGALVNVEPVNQLLREITGMLHEGNVGGIFEWSSEIGYAHYAFVRWGDTLWRSRRSSGPGMPHPASEPGSVGDASWREY